jgi:putative membrane protein
MIKHFAFFLASLLCLGVLDRYVGTISVGQDWFGVLLFLLVLTVINSLVLPLLKFVTFPFNLLSFGLVGMLINLAGLWVAIELTNSINISATGISYFLNLILISFTLSVAQTLVNKIFG